MLWSIALVANVFRCCHRITGPLRTAAPAVEIVALHYRQKETSELERSEGLFITEGSIYMHSESASMKHVLQTLALFYSWSL